MLKVLSYWNLNSRTNRMQISLFTLKVLSYWNLNFDNLEIRTISNELKVLSYWNLNENLLMFICSTINLKYYHIGI